MSAPSPFGSLIVLGGGTAGYFAAISLKRRYPALEVTVVEAPNIPIIGVGEATTTLMPPFLFGELGIDPVELHERVRPTFKLGICFDWGPSRAPRFGYPFGQTEPLAAAAHDGTLLTQSLVQMLMETGRAPIVEREDGTVQSLLPEAKFAYHLDNASFVGFLAEHARRCGVRHLAAEVVRAETDPAATKIVRLHARDGRVLEADLYVDATGFRSTLLGGTLGSPFLSFASSLFCDAAVVGEIPAAEGELRPCTGAERMDAGWTWDIAVEGARHRGYVHSSAYLSLEDAEAELRRKNPHITALWSLRFRSGRRADFLRGNVVAVGNAYGFVEPLESTALHMVILELAWLRAGLGEGPLPHAPPADAVARMNEAVGGHWDYLRWFLALHYKLSPRCETPFWRACHHDTDLSGLDPLLAGLRERGVSSEDREPIPFDPAFGRSGLLTMILGLDPDTYRAHTHVPLTAWRERVAKQRAFVERAVPHRRGLTLLRERPELLRALTAPSSWCVSGRELAWIDAAGRAHLPHDPHPRA